MEFRGQVDLKQFAFLQEVVRQQNIKLKQQQQLIVSQQNILIENKQLKLKILKLEDGQNLLNSKLLLTNSIQDEAQLQKEHKTNNNNLIENRIQKLIIQIQNSLIKTINQRDNYLHSNYSEQIKAYIKTQKNGFQGQVEFLSFLSNIQEQQEEYSRDILSKANNIIIKVEEKKQRTQILQKSTNFVLKNKQAVNKQELLVKTEPTLSTHTLHLSNLIKQVNQQKGIVTPKQLIFGLSDYTYPRLLQFQIQYISELLNDTIHSRIVRKQLVFQKNIQVDTSINEIQFLQQILHRQAQDIKEYCNKPDSVEKEIQLCSVEFNTDDKLNNIVNIYSILSQNQEFLENRDDNVFLDASQLQNKFNSFSQQTINELYNQFNLINCQKICDKIFPKIKNYKIAIYNSWTTKFEQQIKMLTKNTSLFTNTQRVKTKFYSTDNNDSIDIVWKLLLFMTFISNGTCRKGVICIDELQLFKIK